MSHTFNSVRADRCVFGLAIACVVFISGCNNSGGGGGAPAVANAPGRFGAQFGSTQNGSCQLRGILAVQTELAGGSFVPVDERAPVFGGNSNFGGGSRFSPRGGFAPPSRCGTDSCVLERIFSVGSWVLDSADPREGSFRLRDRFQRCGQDAVCQLRVVARLTSLQASGVNGGIAPQCVDVGCLLEVTRSNSIRALSAYRPNAHQVYQAAAASCR